MTIPRKAIADCWRARVGAAALRCDVVARGGCVYMRGAQSDVADFLIAHRDAKASGALSCTITQRCSRAVQRKDPTAEKLFDILSDAVKTRSQCPTSADLSKQLGIETRAVRRAIQRLEMSGRIAIKYRGTPGRIISIQGVGSTSSIRLTKTERAILAALTAAAAHKDRCPTNRELADMVGFCEPSSASKVVLSLARKGRIRTVSFRGNLGRIVEIIETGKRTADPETTECQDNVVASTIPKEDRGNDSQHLLRKKRARDIEWSRNFPSLLKIVPKAFSRRQRAAVRDGLLELLIRDEDVVALQSGLWLVERRHKMIAEDIVRRANTYRLNSGLPMILWPGVKGAAS